MNNSKKFKISLLRNGATFIGSILVIFSIWILWMVWHFPNEDAGYRGISPTFFPYSLGALLLFLSSLLVWHGLKKEESPIFCFKFHCSGTYRMISILVTVILFAWGMRFTGFIPGAIIFISIVQYFLGERKVWFLALNAVTVSLVMYAIFALLFRVPLPLPLWMN